MIVRNALGTWAAAMVAFLFSVVMFGSIASAQAGPTSVPPSAPAGFVLPDGLTVFGADIACPDTAARAMDAAHSAAFVESFIAHAMLGTPQLESPPAGAAVCTATVRWLYGGGTEPTTLTMKYATDGTKSWLLFVGRDVWFVAPPRTKDAFEGKLLPINRNVAPKVTPKPPKADKPKKEEKDSSSWLLDTVAAVAIGVLLAGGAYLVIRRTRGRDGSVEPTTSSDGAPAGEVAGAVSDPIADHTDGTDPVDDVGPEAPR